MLRMPQKTDNPAQAPSDLLVEHSLWRAHSDAVNSKWLGPRLPTQGLVLKTDLYDEAVSTGLQSLLGSRDRAAVGMDLSPRVLKHAQERHEHLRVTRADVRRLPWADGAFDAVVSTSTLDHFASVAEIETSLRELYRVLRPGGALLLTLDNAANPLVAIRNLLPFNLLHRLGLVPYFVGATLGPHGLRRMLQEVGFELRETHALLHCPRVFAVAMARFLDRWAAPWAQSGFLRCLDTFENLAVLPTRFLSGYFIAVRAIRPTEDSP